jgi:hypothetical protein
MLKLELTAQPKAESVNRKAEKNHRFLSTRRITQGSGKKHADYRAY